MAEITLDNKTVHYTTGGKAWEAGLPHLVMIHGAGDDQTVWVMQSRAMAHQGWNVAAVDLPGHGGSEDVEDIRAMEDYGNWLVGVMDGLGIGQAVLAGHSMGGAIALTVAATKPERVQGLALVGTRAALPVSDVLLNASASSSAEAAALVAAFAHDEHYQIGGARNPGTWAFGASRARQEKCPTEVFHRDFEVCNQWNGENYTSNIQCPAIVISGSNDRMTPAVFGKSLAESIKGAEYFEVPGAGHTLMGEKPKEILSLMRKFLKKN